MNIYGGCFGAFRLNEQGQYAHKFGTSIITAKTQHKAVTVLTKLAFEDYPISQGWYGHYAQVSIVTEEQFKIAGYVKK